jgi:hypothetical protein
MQTAPNANGSASVGVNFGMTILCIVPTWIVLGELKGSAEVQQQENMSDEDLDTSAEVSKDLIVNVK